MKNNKTVNYTVAQLIEALKEFPQDLSVLVSGYEDGFENIVEPEIEKLEYKPHNPYYIGEFQEVGKNDSGDTLEAVVLRRVVRNV